MSGLFGKKQDFVIMSPFKAKITYKGEPLRDAKVKLNYSWNSGSDEDYEGYDEYFLTDENGVVDMPAISRKIFVSNVQPTTANYYIEVEYQDEYVDIVSAGKGNPEMYGELGEELKGLTCELTDDFVAVITKDNKALYGTRCSWATKGKWETKKI